KAASIVRAMPTAAHAERARENDKHDRAPDGHSAAASWACTSGTRTFIRREREERGLSENGSGAPEARRPRGNRERCQALQRAEPGRVRQPARPTARNRTDSD